ncbi:hypothetical protein C5C18_01445 [Rathayibacter tritici]|uniref:Uncharacterized protein n=1 Tax=Rathayibacter tritici TaxID=33888 RepID=A0A160KVB8_9MICO|nr:hypothetical protein [Rathayibacter tritici]AND17890.1 hypothetical protein A6122_2781 [Rathayibacter tritici]PPF30557.1 hypothetical protein C5C06_04770 [Rathayibacter tritici]PPF66688.1 hypothetical protein C5C21_08460 [Rathayibacter tritici]PPG09073.1 hypothetical protein C5C18_01445 [Rathayibacter tritici]PPI17855.1 hypothetical protein C5D07_04165 [Rathayibacter tritici]
MDDHARDELAELRRRAYGRRPDIDRDPLARARLVALEAGAPSATDEPAPPVAATPALEQPDSGDPEHPPAPRSARARSVLGRATALLLTAAVAVGATLLVTRTPEPPGREVAVLPLTNGTDIPGWEGLGFDGSVTTDDFGGLTVVRQSRPADTGLTVVRQRRSPSAGSCLYIVRTVDPQDGPFFQGCTAGAFPAVAQFTVTSEASEQLREEYPVGTALRFTLEGNEVHVRADTP